MSDGLEIRIAHLEGAYEQVDKRLGVVESALIQLGSDMNASFAKIDARFDNMNTQVEGRFARTDGRIDGLDNRLTARMDSQFHWLLGTILTSW